MPDNKQYKVNKYWQRIRSGDAIRVYAVRYNDRNLPELMSLVGPTPFRIEDAPIGLGLVHKKVRVARIRPGDWLVRNDDDVRKVSDNLFRERHTEYVEFVPKLSKNKVARQLFEAHQTLLNRPGNKGIRRHWGSLTFDQKTFWYLFAESARKVFMAAAAVPIAAARQAASNTQLNLDIHDEARAVHRVARALHDGECPQCHRLWSSQQVRVGSDLWRCPTCKFEITLYEMQMVIETFGPFMEKNLAVFEEWRKKLHAGETKPAKGSATT